MCIRDSFLYRSKPVRRSIVGPSVSLPVERQVRTRPHDLLPYFLAGLHPTQTHEIEFRLVAVFEKNARLKTRLVQSQVRSLRATLGAAPRAVVHRFPENLQANPSRYR